jgi:hypothetical protein
VVRRADAVVSTCGNGTAGEVATVARVAGPAVAVASTTVPHA